MDKGLRLNLTITFFAPKAVSILGLVDKGLRLPISGCFVMPTYCVSILGLVDKGLRLV